MVKPCWGVKSTCADSKWSTSAAPSIRKWGWTTLVLVNEDGGLIADHARVMAAARQLGLAEIPAWSLQ